MAASLALARLALWAQVVRCTTRPIIAGPFYGEVGFEAMYWVPFLRRLQQRFGLAPSRFIPFTRGGAKVWYEAMADSLDLFDVRTSAQARLELAYQMQRYHTVKQPVMTSWDYATIQDLKRRMGCPKAHVLHPRWAARIFSPWWAGQCWGLRQIHRLLALDPLQPVPLPDGLTLPPSYVAVRFYARYTYPASSGTIDYARAVIRELATRVPVVLLNTGVAADDHFDFDLKGAQPNIVHIHQACSPATNLRVLSAVLSRAKAFIGTHGGIGQLALRYGIPSVTFYTKWGGTSLEHEYLALALARHRQIPYHVLRICETNLLRDVLPAIDAAISS